MSAAELIPNCGQGETVRRDFREHAQHAQHAHQPSDRSGIRADCASQLRTVHRSIGEMVGNLQFGRNVE
jgi:hypothetical protein